MIITSIQIFLDRRGDSILKEKIGLDLLENCVKDITGVSVPLAPDVNTIIAVPMNLVENLAMLF